MIELNTYSPVRSAGMSSPFVSGIGDYSETSEKKSSSGSKSGSTIGGLDKSIIQYIIQNSLYSDAKVFFKNAGQAIDQAYNPSTGQVSLAAYRLLLPEIVRMGNNKEAFKKAHEKMLSNGSQSEVAIDQYGQVYVLNPDATNPSEYLTTKSISEITKQDVLVTNGQLAKYRRDSESAAFNNEYINIIESSTSLEQITKYVRETISGIKSTEQAQEIFKSKDGRVLQGIDILRNYLSGDPALKQEITTKDGSAQAKATLALLINNMPRNMANVLEVHARLNGVNSSQLLYNFILSKVDNSTTIKTDIEKGQNEENNLNNVSATPALAFAMGTTRTRDYVFNNGTSFAYTGTAHVGYINDIDADKTLVELQNSEFMGSLNLRQATFGGLEITDPARIGLLSKEIYSVELPIDKHAPAGVIRPDKDLLVQLSEVKRIAAHEHASSPEELNRICRELEIDELFNADGTLNTQSYYRFAVLHVAVDDSDGEYSDADTTVIHGDESKKDGTHGLRILTTKQDRPDLKDILIGDLYIPMNSTLNGDTNALLSALQAGGAHMSVGQTHKFMEQQAQERTEQKFNYKQPGSWPSFNQ